LARDSDVFNCRHVNQEAAGKSDVRSNASPLLRDGFLRDLDQYLLTLAQEIGNRRLMALTITTGKIAMASAVGRPSIATRALAESCGFGRIGSGSFGHRFFLRRDDSFRLFVSAIGTRHLVFH